MTMKKRMYVREGDFRKAVIKAFNNHLHLYRNVVLDASENRVMLKKKCPDCWTMDEVMAIWGAIGKRCYWMIFDIPTTHEIALDFYI